MTLGDYLSSKSMTIFPNEIDVNIIMPKEINEPAGVL
jgi:hypothetical protein